MATFDYVAWGNGTLGKWLLETGESGVYRGQCTQTVTQFLKDFGYTGWAAARGNGSQVGATMVARGEAIYVGTNLISVPTGEIHVICQEVGTGRAGHVSVAGSGDIVYEENVTIYGLPTRNYGIGNVYPSRIGRLSESFRMTRYHYKVIVDGDFDDIGDGDGGDPPSDDPIGPNQLRYLKGRIIDTKKSKLNKLNSIKDHKRFEIVTRIKGVGQDI